MVEGSHIGTDRSGTADLGNGAAGVTIMGGSKDNVIGGKTATERNVISGNAKNGVSLCIDPGGVLGAFCNRNKIVGNFIGTDASGTVALGNDGHGIEIVSVAGLPEPVQPRLPPLS
ncbi:MAG: hypothetical protein M3135_00720 [Actinomycetota bacterium]|nr:hypothetical protein [Actinomycetota bacterium]